MEDVSFKIMLFQLQNKYSMVCTDIVSAFLNSAEILRAGEPGIAGVSCGGLLQPFSINLLMDFGTAMSSSGR